jgi:hypothetical protein
MAVRSGAPVSRGEAPTRTLVWLTLRLAMGSLGALRVSSSAMTGGR